MHKYWVFVCLVVLLPATLLAQSSGANSAYSDAPSRGTIFGGYSYLRNNGTNFNGSSNFNGFDGQGTFNFSRYVGVTADIGGNYRTLASGSILGLSASANQRLYTFMFGPTVTAPIGRSSVFAHALFGEAHSSLGAGVNIPILGGISTGVSSANAFAMAFGGGVDIGLSKHVAIRAAQVDFIRTQFNSADALTTGLSTDLGDHQNSFRYSGGIVFRF